MITIYVRKDNEFLSEILYKLELIYKFHIIPKLNSRLNVNKKINRLNNLIYFLKIT